MEEIIAPIDKKLLKAELTEDRLFRVSNKAGNQLYIIDNSNAPNVMLEIGRLREIAFRSRNGGSGKSVDLDQFDLDPAYHCKQIIVWDPDAEVIMGGYRFALGDEVLYDRFGQPVIPSSEHFTFSKKFLRNEFLRTIEEDGTWAETYDVLIATIKSCTDNATRYKLMHYAEDILMSTGCIVPLYFYTDIFMISKDVDGFFSNPLGYKYFMYTTVK